LFALVFWREQISERLVPDPRMNQRLEQARAALRQGKLSSPGGHGARELYESVLATDPDQMGARQGLVAVRNAAIARASQDLDGRRLGQARSDLALAETLAAPSVQVEALRSRLQALEEATGNIPTLLAVARAPGTSEDTAFESYGKVLQLDADNAEALEGRRGILSDWLQRADALLDAGKVQQSRELVDRVMAADPTHLDLPPIRARLGEALARLSTEQAGVIALADADERAGRIERAGQSYLQLSQGTDPPAGITEALHRLAQMEAEQARRQAADFQFRRAEASLARARSWSPQSPEVLAAERAVRQSRAAQGRLLRPSGRDERLQLPRLVHEAEDAMARGDFIASPGASAWDKLRVATAISPRAAEVTRLQREFRQGALACFDKSMAAGRLTQAQSCLEASMALDPVTAQTREAMLRLADRWLAYAEERIGASDYPQAERAIGLARRWQPGHPGIKPIAERLRQARGTR
jgi:tetratricopeptide (TPR) repeat protein